jgi:hypothetical protein
MATNRMFAISARSRRHQPANSPSASTGRATPGPEDLRVSHRPGTPSQLRRSAIDLLPQRDAGSIFLDSLSVARELGGMSPDASGRPQSQPWHLFPAPEALYGARPPETAAKQAPAAHIAASLYQVPPHRCECHSSATRPGSVPGSRFEKTPSPGAPLRNRAVDLLLTMWNADVQYRQMMARDGPCGSMPHGPRPEWRSSHGQKTLKLTGIR